MESHRLTENELKIAFYEVRKAHRLIYEYQRRMQDLSWFIRNKLGFDEYKGWKKFSDPLSSRNTIYVNNWSWDWIYSYVYEYCFGEQTIEGNDNSWKLSIIQVSDTGYYQNRGNGAKPTQLQTFASVDKSESKILFYLSLAKKSAKKYDWNSDKIINKYAVQDGFFKLEEHPNHIQIVYSVPMWKFVDENATMQILRKFVDYCNKNAGTNLKIQE